MLVYSVFFFFCDITLTVLCNVTGCYMNTAINSFRQLLLIGQTVNNLDFLHFIFHFTFLFSYLFYFMLLFYTLHIIN